MHVLARGVRPPWQTAARWARAGDRRIPAPCWLSYGAPGAATTATAQGQGSHAGPPMGWCSHVASLGNRDVGVAGTEAPGWLPAADEQAPPRGQVGSPEVEESAGWSSQAAIPYCHCPWEVPEGFQHPVPLPPEEAHPLHRDWMPKLSRRHSRPEAGKY